MLFPNGKSKVMNVPKLLESAGLRPVSNQGYGPYVMAEWIHDASMTMVKNPYWPGTDSVPVPAIDVVELSVLTDSSALSEFESGNLDVVGIPSSDYDRIMADPDYSQWLFPSNTLWEPSSIHLNTTLAPTDDVRVRQALSMAIDRDALIAINKSGIAASWFSHPGAVAAPQIADYPDLGVKYDPEGAKALLDEYLEEKGLTAEELNITLMFNTSEGHKMRAEIVQQMWKTVLGIDVQLTNQDMGSIQRKQKYRRRADLPQFMGPGLPGCQEFPLGRFLNRWRFLC